MEDRLHHRSPRSFAMAAHLPRPASIGSPHVGKAVSTDAAWLREPRVGAAPGTHHPCLCASSGKIRTALPLQSPSPHATPEPKVPTAVSVRRANRSRARRERSGSSAGAGFRRPVPFIREGDRLVCADDRWGADCLRRGSAGLRHRLPAGRARRRARGRDDAMDAWGSGSWADHHADGDGCPGGHRGGGGGHDLGVDPAGTDPEVDGVPSSRADAEPRAGLPIGGDTGDLAWCRVWWRPSAHSEADTTANHPVGADPASDLGWELVSSRDVERGPAVDPAPDPHGTAWPGNRRRGLVASGAHRLVAVAAQLADRHQPGRRGVRHRL